MRRTSPKEQARARIFDDDELRACWKAAEANGVFGAFIRIALLTGQRRDKVAAMRWQDIDLDGVWRIPAEAREKTNAGELVLPEMALAIIKAQPRLAGNEHVFPGRGASPISGFSALKRSFDAKTGIKTQWQIHDLRRTARSLMSRAGVNSEHAERVLGHVQQGVLGVYNRHSYREEKAHALRQLAGLIETILRGPVDNVIPIAG
jgi:integrase